MLCVMQRVMNMQDATNLETTYSHACECMYGMCFARWHEKTKGWILCIIHCDMNPKWIHATFQVNVKMLFTLKLCA